MEEICSRCPHVGEKILSHLNPTSLRVVKQSCKSICAFVESTRLYWILLIQKRFEVDNLPQQWELLLNNTPIKILKMITVDIMKFSQLENEIQYYHYERITDDGQLSREISPLHIAAATNNTILSTYIINRFGYSVLNTPNGERPLHMAARMGHHETYKIMTKDFAIEDINPPNQFGETPFHLAAIRGHLNMCKYLFAVVRDKNPRRRPFGQIPLGLAYANKHMLLFLHMYKKSDIKNPETNWRTGNTLLHDVVLHEDIGIYKFIIKSISDKNPTNHNGQTPLHLAAKVGCFELFDLIYKNTDIKNPTDHDGRMPLDHARLINPRDKLDLKEKLESSQTLIEKMKKN